MRCAKAEKAIHNVTEGDLYSRSPAEMRFLDPEKAAAQAGFVDAASAATQIRMTDGRSNARAFARSRSDSR